MSQTSFYKEQAAAALGLAQKAELPNVRQRYLTSHTVWAQLAERAERLEAIEAASPGSSW